VEVWTAKRLRREERGHELWPWATISTTPGTGDMIALYLSRLRHAKLRSFPSHTYNDKGSLDNHNRRCMDGLPDNMLNSPIYAGGNLWALIE